MEETQKMFRQGDSGIRKSKTAFIGSILLVISALLPFLDVLAKWFFPSIIDSKDSTGTLISTDIWIATLYIAPVVIILAVNFNPNPKVYFFPLFTFLYTGIVYFSPVFGFKVDFLKLNSLLTAFLAIIAVLLLLFIFKYVRRLALVENSEDEFINEVKREFNRLSQENYKLKNGSKLEEKK